MQVFVTREYQYGDEAGESRAYANVDAAKLYLESTVPARDRIVWKEPYPGRWIGRIKGAAKELALYVERYDVHE